MITGFVIGLGRAAHFDERGIYCRGFLVRRVAFNQPVVDNDPNLMGQLVLVQPSAPAKERLH